MRRKLPKRLPATSPQMRVRKRNLGDQLRPPFTLPMPIYDAHPKMTLNDIKKIQGTSLNFVNRTLIPLFRARFRAFKETFRSSKLFTLMSNLKAHAEKKRSITTTNNSHNNRQRLTPMQRFPSLSSANIFLDDSLDDSHEEKEEIDLLETPLESRPTPFAMSRHHRTRHLPLRRQLR